MPLSRRATLPLLLALDLLLVVALAAVVWFDNAHNRGITFAPAPPPIPRGGPPAVGVNLFNLHVEPDPAVVTRTFELAAAMGARYGRMQAPWDDIEIHARGDFEDRRNLETVGAVSSWAKYDRIVQAANAAGVELIWRLERPPVWARQQAEASPFWQAGLAQDGNSMAPPDDLADYAAFVRAVVERYDGDGVDDAPNSPTVRHFQIWNEPNLKNEWGWQTPRPEDFVDLLRAGAEAARAASPEAVILFPGLAPTDGLDARAPMTELEYLDRVYKAGGAAYFDVMAAQGYGLGQPPDEHRYVFLRGRGNWSWSQPIDTRNDVGRVVLLREVMLANGDGDTPVWITEFGWNAAPATIPPERRFTWGPPVSEEQKGEYLVGQLERARTEWPWMGVMNVWMLRYGGYAEPDPADPTPYFALVTRDWQTLPAYAALQAYTATPRPNEAPARPLGPLWDYGPLLLILALAGASAATATRLFPTLVAAGARFQETQRQMRGRSGFVAVLVRPDTLMFLAMLLAVIVAYRASPQLPLTVLGLMLFATLALWRPDLGLLFVPLALPLYFIPKAIFDARFGIRESGIYLPLHEILLLIVLAAASLRLLWALLRGWRPVLADWRRLIWPLAPVTLFALAGLWGLLIAQDRGPALREFRWLIIEPLLFVALAAGVALWWRTSSRGNYWHPLLGSWLVGAAVAGTVGIFQLLGLNLVPLFGTKVGFSEDSFLVEGVRRVSSLYGHPNNLGLAMGRAWPIAAALAHAAFWGAATRREGFRRALPWIVVTGLCVGGLLASFSRGAYLGAAAAALVLAALLLPRALLRDQRVRLGLGGLVGLGLLAVVAVIALDIERFNPLGASSGVRIETWRSALAMLRDHPLGIGLDQFGRLYPQYINPALAGTNEINTAHPHTLLLDIPLRMGPLGLVAFAWLVAGIFVGVRRGLAATATLRPAHTPAWLPETDAGRALLVGVAAALVAALVHGLVDQFYFWPDLAFAFWLLVALGWWRPALGSRD